MSRKLTALCHRGNFVNKSVFLCSALLRPLEETFCWSQKFRPDINDLNLDLQPLSIQGNQKI